MGEVRRGRCNNTSPTLNVMPGRAFFYFAKKSFFGYNAIDLSD